MALPIGCFAEQRGLLHRETIDSCLNVRYIDNMPTKHEHTNKRDHSKYGYAIRLPLNDREREALRMLAAEKNESQGAVIAEILRKALTQSGWLKPIENKSQPTT